jgi:hypothetical protein
MDKNKLNGIRLHEEKPKWMKGTIHKDTNCEGMDDFGIFLTTYLGVSMIENFLTLLYNYLNVIIQCWLALGF